MARTTRDRLELLNKGVKGKFAAELNAWKDQWQKKHHPDKYGALDKEFAAALGVAPAVISDWLNAITMPNYDRCKVIANVVGLSEDYVLQLAGRPNFSELIERMLKAPDFKSWKDGEAILYVLKQTQTGSWGHSHSFWKDEAEREMQSQWKKDGKDLHEAVRRVALWVYQWASDRKRETPFEARNYRAEVTA